MSGPAQATCSNTFSSTRSRLTQHCVSIIQQKTDCNICTFTGSCTTNHLTLFPSQLLECLSFCTCTVFESSAQLYSLYFFSLCIVTTFIYSICIVKADSRLVVYRFILFYFVLYICINVAPRSCEAQHLRPTVCPHM